MDLEQAMFLALASAAASAVNAVAGGGTLLTFPAALAVGIPPITASATSSMSLAPGALAAAWAYRRELEGKARIVTWLALPSMLGGLLGAKLLLEIDAKVFGAIVPWMVLAATALIVARDILRRRAVASSTGISRRRAVVVGVCLLCIAVYGGLFGAAKNIVILALLTLLQRLSLHEVNALKSVVVGFVTLVSSTYFIIEGAAHLPAVGVMAAGAVIGSYSSANLARRVDPVLIRYAVVAIGVFLSGALAYQRWLI